MMQEQMQERLRVLRKEFATGQARLQELEQQQECLRETMLRISGAIQVLEELLDQSQTRLENRQPPEAISLAMVDVQSFTQ